jgi:hypothetical protein
MPAPNFCSQVRTHDLIMAGKHCVLQGFCASALAPTCDKLVRSVTLCMPRRDRCMLKKVFGSQAGCGAYTLIQAGLGSSLGERHVL